MTFAEQVAEAKKIHWGMYCGIHNTCTKDVICSVACPNGGVDGEKDEYLCKTLRKGRAKIAKNTSAYTKAVS